MKCYAYQLVTKLLQFLSAAPVTATTNGTAYRILPGSVDEQTDDQQDFRFVTAMTFSGGATSPTAQCPALAFLGRPAELVLSRRDNRN